MCICVRLDIYIYMYVYTDMARAHLGILKGRGWTVVTRQWGGAILIIWSKLDLPGFGGNEGKKLLLKGHI